MIVVYDSEELYKSNEVTAYSVAFCTNRLWRCFNQNNKITQSILKSIHFPL